MANNIVQGEWDWMNQMGGIDPRMGMGSPSAAPPGGGLLGKIAGGMGGILGVPSGGGMIAPEDRKAMLMQALGTLGANLMSQSGWSPNRVSTGQALGNAILATQQQSRQAGQDALQAMLLKSKLQQKEKPKRYVVNGALVDESGKPIYESPVKPGGGMGAIQPGDYTPESLAKYQKTGNIADLERYSTPRQEFSPSFQNVTKTLPDGSTQQGTFNTRTGEYNWAGEVVPAGTKARTDAAGRAEGTITGTRTAKAETAYPVFQTGMKSLEEAMSATETGPLAGRIPALTAGQQIAEGAEATMAPVLKQLFRDAGEGTFTDADQAMLMKMVPTRKDHPEARKAKIEMIDGIVRAKLGIGGTEAATQPQAPAAAIEYLRKNPQYVEQFKAKYGYVPDGI